MLPGADLRLRSFQIRPLITSLQGEHLLRLNQLGSRQEFLDLVRYLVEIAAKGPGRAKELRPAQTASAGPAPRPADDHFLGELRLVRYRPLFSGPQVERVAELQFQRPRQELELSASDAAKRQIAAGDTAVVRSDGTSVELRARINRRLMAGVIRIADEHAADLHPTVEVVKT